MCFLDRNVIPWLCELTWLHLGWLRSGLGVTCHNVLVLHLWCPHCNYLLKDSYYTCAFWIITWHPGCANRPECIWDLMYPVYSLKEFHTVCAFQIVTWCIGCVDWSHTYDSGVMQPGSHVMTRKMHTVWKSFNEWKSYTKSRTWSMHHAPGVCWELGVYIVKFCACPSFY